MATKKSSNKNSKSNVVTANQASTSNHSWVREKDLNTKEVSALKTSKEAKKAEKAAKKAEHKSANAGLTKAKKRKIIVVSTTTLVIGGVVTSMILGPMFLGSGSTSKSSHIGYMPNTTLVDDNSFNEFTSMGVQKYQDQFLPSNEEVRTYKVSDDSMSTSTYEPTINQMISGGSDIIISNSYAPAEAYLCSAVNNSTVDNPATTDVNEEDNSVSYILVDDGGKELANASSTGAAASYYTSCDLTDTTAIAEMNGLSVNFMANEAGFIAGLAASVYAVVEDSTQPVVGTFGGMPYSTVYDWMSGYEQAVNWFNYAILGYSLDGTELAPVAVTSTTNTQTIDETTQVYKADDLQDLFDHSDVVAASSDDNNEMYAESLALSNTYSVEKVIMTSGTHSTVNSTGNSISGNTVINYEAAAPAYSTISDTWYTNGFTSDGTSGTDADTTSSAIQADGAEVIFPVAGVQTYNALNIADNEPAADAMKVIGVDTDQTLVATETQSDYFLGSATKNLEAGTIMSLWYANDFMKKYDGDASNMTFTNPADFAMLSLISTPTDEVAMTYSMDTDGDGDKEPVDIYGWNGGMTDDYWTYGPSLTGTYQNNGVGWTDGGDEDGDGVKNTSEAWNTFATTYNIKYVSTDTANASWDQFLSASFASNTLNYGQANAQLLIEYQSESFADETYGELAPYTNSVRTGNGTGPVWWWIPNWTVYQS